MKFRTPNDIDGSTVITGNTGITGMIVTISGQLLYLGGALSTNASNSVLRQHFQLHNNFETRTVLILLIQNGTELWRMISVSNSIHVYGPYTNTNVLVKGYSSLYAKPQRLKLIQ